MSLPPTLQAAPGYLEKQAERIEKWKDIVRSDPRRAVRVLTLSGMNTETVEGDTAFDSQYVLAHCKEIAKNSKDDAWKNLVNAGVGTALCKGALNMQAAVMTKHDKVSKKEIEEVAKQMFGPYYFPLEIICNALVSSPPKPGPTEQKLVEDVKKHWTSIMQRVWSEPAYSLESEPKTIRTLERVVIPQMLFKLIAIDPSFLDTITKPNDLTLAVLFRYWMYGTSVPDTRSNLAILLPMLDMDPPPPPYWQKYCEEHPLPPINERLTRMLLGASKAAGSEKKKRTPGQAADAIASAFAAHIDALALPDVLIEYNFFHALLSHARKDTAHKALPRAVYKSSAFWEANARVLRRVAAEDPPNPYAEPVFMAAMMTYSSVIHQLGDDEGREVVDMLIYTWVTTGLFDALEHARAMIVKVPRGPMVLIGILGKIEQLQHSLSLKTRRAVHAELPRPHLAQQLIAADHASGGNGTLSELQEVATSNKTALPQKAMWLHGAWQLLATLEATVGVPGECARRGCEREAKTNSNGQAQHVCGTCKETAYCSMGCLEKDKADHGEFCESLPLWKVAQIREIIVQHDEEPATSTPAAAAPSSSPSPPSMAKLSLGELD